MKKYLKYVFLLILLVLFFGLNKVEASTGSTVFIGEPVILDSYNDVEDTYNYVNINEETSEITNIQMFTNLTDRSIIKKASIKLEDSFSNFTINSLKIKVNELEINEITKDGDNYIFYFQILPKEVKKIEISYKTDNDLQNAKIIKYTMDGIKGQNVKLFQINIKLSKYDIPLVQKIWPGAYEFDDNIVSTEYVDFKVNNLTSSIILQKETYRNIKYGEFADTLSNIDEYILEHAKDLIDGNVPNYSYDYYVYTRDVVSEWVNGRKFGLDDHVNESLLNVVEYSLILDANIKNKLMKEDEMGYVSTTINYYNDNYCLTSLIYNNLTKDAGLFGTYDDKNYENFVGKMMAINYYETEQGKDLYVNKDTTNNKHSVEVAPDKFVLTKRDEYSILRTIVAGGAPITGMNDGIKKVYVNSDIDGNKIDITEEEIIDFVNMMNIDLYIRIVLYDPSEKSPEVYAGYYTDESKQIAMEYLEINDAIKQEERYIKSLREDSNYRLTEEEIQERTDNSKKRIEEVNGYYKKFENETVKNNSKVPTIAHCVGICNFKDGKYVIEFNDTSDTSGLFYAGGAIECDAAQKLLKENKANNEAKKTEIVNRITNSKMTIDVEEYKKPEELSDEQILDSAKTKDNNIINFIINNKLVLILIVVVIILIIVLIIFIIIRRKKNGRK